ncbi:3565_t:CDS:2 [Entrophospora sp. SA101]|nr:3565_t:CDS:2 [Entrophospora sp. SA101]CAJ0916492.1 12179_t:CDS:2 [Entrophospora sp. SA101]
MLVDDMGGHGRALEVLQNSLHNRDMDNCNFLDLMNNIRTQLKDRYITEVETSTIFKKHSTWKMPHSPQDCSISNTLNILLHVFEFLKSEIFDSNKWILLRELYNGARHSFGDAGLKISEYYKYCIINAPNAQTDDFVCGIRTNKDKTDEYVSEVHQCNLLKKRSVNQKIYMEEHENTAADDDILYCKRPFKDLDDCESRTKIPRMLLEQFQLR